MKDKPAKMVRISTDHLLTGDRTMDFAIYTRRSDNHDPILLIPANTDLARVREVLAGRKHGPLFITENAVGSFQNFMEESMGAIIEDPSVPQAEKAILVHTCAKNVMQDVFDNPRSGRNVSRARQVTNSIIRLTIADQEAIPNLLRLGSHNYYTFSHCVNVAVFGVGLWLRINRGGEQELLDFALGCILHDVGKTGIRQGILNKPGKLDDEEFRIIMDHPTMGYNLMTEHAPETALDVILHHHEKIDGRGYPQRLKGGDISDNAKIAAIADVYDALTTNRPYADARLPFNALALMKREMVGHFEEETFNKFVLFLGNRPS
jgi:HD-GYP domain-containing protein (c-di-GMP phosphodiesterase class II)